MVYCAVYGCKSSNKGCEKIVFHRFPSNTAESAKWLQFCRRADTVNLKNAAICGLHFKPSDYRRNLCHELLNPGQPERRPKLKHGAVPSVDMPKCDTSDQNDFRLRKKYLQEDSFIMQPQQEDKRCHECGPEFECMSSPVSPTIMHNIKLEDKDYSRVLPSLRLEILDSHLEKDGICDIFSEDPESIADIMSYDCPAVCLVCDSVIKDSSANGVSDLFLESSVTTHTQQQLVVMLAVLINTPLTPEEAYSRSLCQRCFKLLDQLDETQHQTAVIKSNIESLYALSLQKRNLSKHSSIDEELPTESSVTSVHDHQYIKQSESEEKNEQSLLYADNSKIKECISEPFDRNQWRKDEAVRDALRRERDPVYRETIRKGWRERKAKQRMKVSELDNTMKQTTPTNDECSMIDVDYVLSSFVNTQSNPEITNEMQVTHTIGTSNQIFDTDEKQQRNPKPITIKVFKTDYQVNHIGNELQLAHSSLKSRTKRPYRKRSDIVHLCKFCMKVFLTGEELKKHQKTHTTIECKFCGKILVRIGAWENHLKTFHNVEIQNTSVTTEEVFPCEKCNKQFASKSALRYHVKLHDGRIYTCEKCNKEFNHPGTFKNHQLIHEDKKFICDKCGKGFRTNFHLVMHDNQTHRKARSWQCKYCEKAFARCATFREHMRSHSTEKMEPSANIHIDVPTDLDLNKEESQSSSLEPESLNENGNIMLNEGCKMLSIGEEIVSEEARITIDENESSACEEQNLIINSGADLYGEEFVISDDGNLIIGSLMDVK